MSIILIMITIGFSGCSSGNNEKKAANILDDSSKSADTNAGTNVNTTANALAGTQKQEVNALTFYHWWTSASEAAAINALIKVFTDKYPDTAVMPTPVIGGAGYTMFGIVQPLVIAGEAPDAFQMHAGYEAKPYFDAGLLDPIDALWKSENLEAIVPSVVQDMCKFDGHYYAVPVDVHRSNLVWYNKPLLDKNGIDPSKLTTWDDFFAACDKLKASGVESWTESHVLEQIIASQGIDFYQDFVNGKVTSPDDPKLVKSLEIFKKYLSYTNPDSASLSWDVATKRIIKGEGAFNIMGDWANGEFKIIGMVYGKDYGTFTVPGTSNMYGLVVDTFQHPKGALHPTNSEKWLKVVVSKEGQDAFNPKKGSISVRSDSDVTRYDDYQKSAIADFKNATYLFPSVVHGSGAPEQFKIKLNEVVTTFLTDLDVPKAATALTAETKTIAGNYSIVWSLK
jgi:glucose/mannose transport system substrate-binding protein